jgi:UMP-CMP kinase
MNYNKTLPKVLFILGPPAVGKGTHCMLIAKKLNLLHLSAGELLRQEIYKKNSTNKELIQNCLEKGKIVPVEITCSLLRREMEKNGNYSAYLIDGFPRNFDNLYGWRREMVDKVKLVATILIECEKVKNDKEVGCFT